MPPGDARCGPFIRNNEQSSCVLSDCPSRVSDGDQLAQAGSNTILPFQAKQKALPPLSDNAEARPLYFFGCVHLFLLLSELGASSGKLNRLHQVKQNFNDCFCKPKALLC